MSAFPQMSAQRMFGGQGGARGMSSFFANRNRMKPMLPQPMQKGQIGAMRPQTGPNYQLLGGQQPGMATPQTTIGTAPTQPTAPVGASMVPPTPLPEANPMPEPVNPLVPPFDPDNSLGRTGGGMGQRSWGGMGGPQAGQATMIGGTQGLPIPGQVGGQETAQAQLLRRKGPFSQQGAQGSPWGTWGGR